jgi:hypothetical protein
MFALIEILLVPVAWHLGKVFANYFEAKRPRKMYALGFSLLLAISLFSVFAIVRYYGASWMLDDRSLGIRVDWFGPLDPPALFLYGFFAYNGAISFYKKPKL